MGDNYGGQFRTPAYTNTDGRVQPASYVYSMGRELPGFAPRIAPYDNLPTTVRTQASWVTYDGLSWRQRWWGEMPLQGAQGKMRIPENCPWCPLCWLLLLLLVLLALSLFSILFDTAVIE